MHNFEVPHILPALETGDSAFGQPANTLIVFQVFMGAE